MFEKIDDFIKNLFRTVFGKKKKNIPVLTPEEEAAKRAKLFEEINHPEDGYVGDEVFDEEELKRISDRNRNKNNQRVGYYIFGTVLACAMILYGLISMLVTKQPDLYVLVQTDGFVTQSDLDLIEQYFGSVAGDLNSDGVVKIAIATADMPAEHTADNESLFETGASLVREAMTPYKYATIIGREDFLQAADDFRGLLDLADGEEKYPLSETTIELAQDSPLRAYYIGIREQQNKTEDYSAQACAVFEKMIG